jgi:predicted RNA-binding Zn-ribbon protein involved in translation (DUF1610 family)
MKSELMTHYCMDKKCGWEVTGHKNPDARRCPECDGFVMSEYAKGRGQSESYYKDNRKVF